MKASILGILYVRTFRVRNYLYLTELKEKKGPDIYISLDRQKDKLDNLFFTASSASPQNCAMEYLISTAVFLYQKVSAESLFDFKI